MLKSYFGTIFCFLAINTSKAGNNVSAAVPEPNMFIDTSKPKFWNGAICEKVSTINPAATEAALMITAFPLILNVFSIAFSEFPSSFICFVKPEITCME